MDRPAVPSNRQTQTRNNLGLYTVLDHASDLQQNFSKHARRSEHVFGGEDGLHKHSQHAYERLAGESLSQFCGAGVRAAAARSS